jgi:hypothetical protein
MPDQAVISGGSLHQAEWVQRVLGVEIGGEDASGSLGADDYPQHLREACKRMKSVGAAQFGLALGAHPAEHRMALHPTRAGHALSTTLMRQTGLQAVTWGSARPTPDRPASMDLLLEGRQLPGVRKRTQQMLRACRPLPFVKVRLLVDGAEADDLPDEATDAPDPDAAPVSVLPRASGEPGRQSATLIEAAAAGVALCEECAPPVDADG